MGSRRALSIAGFKLNFVFDLNISWLLKGERLSKATDKPPAAGSAAAFVVGEPGTALSRARRRQRAAGFWRALLLRGSGAVVAIPGERGAAASTQARSGL